MSKNTFFQALTVLSIVLAGHASAACVNVSEVNLRKGPGTQHEKSWVVYRYMPLKPVEKSADWTQVKDVDGDTHWVLGSLLSDRIQCGVVKVNKANVRSGPGSNYGKTPLNEVEKNYTFKVIGEEGDWVHVEDEVKNQGWVSKELLWRN